MKHLECVLCKKTYPIGAYFTCPCCGEKGILDVVYDYETIKKFMTKDTLKQDDDHSMFRYRYLLPVQTDHMKDMLKIGWTPFYRAHRLETYLGLRKLFIKDESVNPSGSLKDRASAIAVLQAIDQGVNAVSCSSTGNAASSLACHAARMGIPAYIFVPKRAPIGKVNQLLLYGAHVTLVDGDYNQTYQLSKEAIEHFGWYNRNAAVNPYLVEGKKTVGYEIFEQKDLRPTDWIAVSVGDGCTIAGIYKAIYDFKKLGLIHKIPKLLGVQSEGCAPFVEAYQTQSPLKKAEEHTIADSIAVGVPRNPIKAIHAVEKTHGAWIAVPDENILEAMRLLGTHEGLCAEPASAAALAGIKEALKQGIIKPNESVVMIHTGHGLKDPVNAQKAVGSPPLCSPELNAFIKQHESLKETPHD
ncbi:MAG: threonine synthase [Acholeplasma sp.]|jgi:threonine synthase|nr:MAG: threonine synthase [Acholeplasma sp.]